MSAFIPERRRSQRVAMGKPGGWLSLPSSWAIQLTDVGMGGLAFTSPHPLDIGRTVRVRTTLGREAFSVELTISWARHESGASTIGRRCEMGGAFVTLDEGSRNALERFLKLSPE